jgi:nucleoid-associated protein YgaU
VIVMTPVSIVKLVASACVLVAAGGAALFFGLKHDERLETRTVAATTSPSQPAPGVRNESSLALAATETKAAALGAEPARSPGVIATDRSVPSFDLARIEGAEAVIAGRAAPGAIVDLLRDGERLDRAVADASGQFVMVPLRLPAGSYELTLSARLPDGTVASSKQGVKVTVDDVGVRSGAAQSRAEYIPESPSQMRPPLQPPWRAAKPQQSVALKLAHANFGSSASEQGAPSPAVAPRNLTRVISPGDSLWRISRITYGDGARYVIVYRANQDKIRDPDLIHPGQILVLPMKRH